MLEYILDGGFIMIPLILLSVLALAVIIERLRAFRLAETDSRELRTRFIGHLKSGEMEEAITTCEEVRGPVSAVLLVGLKKYMHFRGTSASLVEIEETVNKAMSDYAPHVIETLEKRLNLLALVASVSPLLGMTGTVTGMIAAFDAIQRAGTLEGSAVAGGISEALITTATGLIIAIPAAVFYNVFSKKVDRYTLDIEATASEMMESLALFHRAE